MKHTGMTSLTSFLRRCYLLSLLRPMLPSVGGFAISSDCAFSCEIFLCYVSLYFILNSPVKLLFHRRMTGLNIFEIENMFVKTLL